MIFGFVLILHIVVAIFLIIVILLQGGRGGLSDAIGGSGGQSLFGGGANIVMAKVTAVGAGLFMVTCLLLAKLSSQRGRSVIEQVPLTLPGVALPSPESLLPGGEPATPPAPLSTPPQASSTVVPAEVPAPAAPSTPPQ